MKLIHLSDTHIIPAPGRLYGLDPRARLAAAVADINRHHPDADICVVTGDLAHLGEPAAYAVLGEILGNLVMPYVLLIGNHDNREAFRRAFPKAMSDDDGFVQGVVDLDSHALVCLDTNLAGTHAGEYCTRRRSWLSRTLKALNRPVLLFMHHPPFASGVAAMDAIGLRDPGAFAEIMRPYAGNIRHLFLGHLHLGVAGSWLGIPFTVLPAQNHQVDFERSASGPGIWCSAGAPRYGVVLVDHDRVVVHERSYLAPVSSFLIDAAPGDGEIVPHEVA